MLAVPRSRHRPPEPSGIRRFTGRLGLSIVVGAVLLAASSCGLGTDPSSSGTSNEAERATTVRDADGSARTESLGLDLGRLESAVVNIYVDGVFEPPTDDGYWAFGGGTGVIVSPTGLVLTNNHVVAGATTITVLTSDGQELNATRLGSSECDDLAAIQLPAGEYEYLPIASDMPAVGTEVYAAGFPAGGDDLENVYTLTKGIVSSIRTDAKSYWAVSGDEIEHDAQIRSGNSGGPLVSMGGEIVGLNYGVDIEFRANYAIPLPRKRSVVDELLAANDVNYFGAHAMAVTEEDTEEGIPGVWIFSVEGDSAADELGLRPGDLITEMDGRSIAPDGTLARFCEAIAAASSGDAISVEVYRPESGLVLVGEINGDALTSADADGASTPDRSPRSGTETTEFSLVVDDSGSIEVELPDEWDDVDGAADPGTGLPQLQASPDIAEFTEYFGTPGVTLRVLPAADAEGTLDVVEGFDYSDSCDGAAITAYRDTAYSGHQRLWSGCPDRTELLVLAVTAGPSDEFIVKVEIQTVGASREEVRDRVLSSFFVYLE